MRRPSALLSKHEEDNSDSLSTTAPHSNNNYLDDSVSPFLQDNSNESDSETLSDSSKKIKKKRSTYQKIPDDIRINLLDCVKNGETLKSAAKRFKINYSSAKSILHTYRKEGRILKKPAQERTTKKKSFSPDDDETPVKPLKPVKKDRIRDAENRFETPKSLGPLSERANSQALDNNSQEKRTREVSKDRLKDNFEAHSSKTANHNVENTHPKAYTQEHDNKYKTYDYFQDAPHSEPTNNQVHHQTENTNSHHADNHMNFSSEFYSFHDMFSSNQRKISYDSNSFMCPKDFSISYMDDDKYNRRDHDGNFEHGSDTFENCPLKSFMDTQKLLQEAFRKTSFSYNGDNNNGYRKGSVDFFF